MKTYLKPQTEVNSIACGMNLLQMFAESHETGTLPGNPSTPGSGGGLG